MPVTLVLGGARSGKSRFAESLAGTGRKTYIATAEAFDAEMRARIAKHRAERGDGWETVEAPLGLVEALAGRTGFVLVDCVTVWLGNLMHAELDWEPRVEALCSALTGDVAVVSNEVGQGIVPENALARRFRDAQGIANQRIAGVADQVFFLTAGLPQRLK